MAQPISIILDADTGNEMDDLYAIVRAIQSPELEVIALTSAHFNNAQMLTDSVWNGHLTKDIQTTQISQSLNESLLNALGKTAIPHPLGVKGMVGYGWGYYDGAPIPTAPAIDFIIKKARGANPQNKLNIVSIGAVSNVAAAVLRAPDIASSILCYLLGMHYDHQKAAWDKSEFNARNGINGLNELLNNEAIEMIVMPANIAESLQFSRRETFAKLKKIDTRWSEILADRWDSVNAGDTWVMWDLALIEAILNPSSARLEERLTPPENTMRFIKVYMEIDAEQMQQSFWKKIN